jgi:hypothetical protein
MTQEVTTKAKFPSVEWFNAVRDLVQDDPEYRHIGTCDSSVGLKVTDAEKYYVLTFEAFEVADVKETSEAQSEEVDFWLEMSLAGWKEMIDNIKEHGKADLDHTLNTIDLKDPEGLARSHDGYRRDAFYRFNQTFQYFFDVTAKIDTQY